MIISRPTMSRNAVAMSTSSFAGIFRTSRHNTYSSPTAIAPSRTRTIKEDCNEWVMFPWMIIRVAARHHTPLWKASRSDYNRPHGGNNEADRVFSSTARSRSRTFAQSTRTDPGRTVQLEAAREVDDLRLSREHGRDHPDVDLDGDRPRRTRRRTGERPGDKASSQGNKGSIVGGARRNCGRRAHCARKHD